MGENRSRALVDRRRVYFWCGVASITAGVLLHLPMYAASADMGYMMAGMSMDPAMKLGMVLIVLGTVAATIGLLPTKTAPANGRSLKVVALDTVRIGPAHIALLLVLATAVTIDVMKPTTLAFVLPGMTAEYDLHSTSNPDGDVPAAWLPMSALSGMVLGSLVWGALADRIGRRASIVLAGVMFIGTSICGAMPSFGWNLAMCFLMGVAVGGMLPIAFALLAETIPARHRSWLMVLIGGDVAGAYVLVSFLSSALQPIFGWRVLWLLGLPTGILMIAISRWLPESPRFLLLTGRLAEAQQVMARFGAELVEVTERAETRPRGSYLHLMRMPFGRLSLSIALFGVGWGLVNSGFLLWLPTNLREAGLAAASTDSLLASAAVLGFPATFLVAFLYGFWSSKWTMVMCAGLTALSLIIFAAFGNRLAEHSLLLRLLIMALIAGTSSVLATLTPYASEVFPTHIRARGAGIASMSARVGGLVAVFAVLAGLATPTIASSAMLGAVPMAIGAAGIAIVGVETRRRRVEEISRGLQE